MQNGEYYWIRPEFGGEWVPAKMVGVSTEPWFAVPGVEDALPGISVGIGPKVIGHDELIVPARVAANLEEVLRDRLAMAAPTDEISFCFLAGGEQKDIEKICKARYAWADAMMAERVK